MNTILKILVFLSMTIGIFGQDNTERISAQNENDSCSICLPDGNYNLYSYIKDSTNLGKLNPTIGVEINGGQSSTQMGSSLNHGFNVIFGIISGIEFNVGSGTLSELSTSKSYVDYSNDSTWRYSGITKLGITFNKTEYGIKIIPITIGNFQPFIQYAIATYDIEYETSSDGEMYNVQGNYVYHKYNNEKAYATSKESTSEFSLGTKVNLLKSGIMSVGMKVSATFSSSTPNLTDIQIQNLINTNKFTFQNYQIGIYIQY